MLVAVFPNEDYYPLDEIPSYMSDDYKVVEVPDDADIDEFMNFYLLEVQLGNGCESSKNNLTIH